MAILHLTEDSLGVSHFSDIGVPLDPGAFAPPAPPRPVSGAEPATGLLYLILPAGWGRAQHYRRTGFREVPGLADLPGIVEGADLWMELIPSRSGAKENRLA
jgi:hypothetical protein